MEIKYSFSNNVRIWVKIVNGILLTGRDGGAGAGRVVEKSQT